MTAAIDAGFDLVLDLTAGFDTRLYGMGRPPRRPGSKLTYPQ
ncbi:hypothetical protein [Nocardia sp. NBC_00511]